MKEMRSVCNLQQSFRFKRTLVYALYRFSLHVLKKQRILRVACRYMLEMYTRLCACVQINKQYDQMNTLLALCLVLHPMRIDESVHSGLKEKFGDKMQRMQKGSEQL